MVEFRNGENSKPATSAALCNFFEKHYAEADGLVYFGYPLLFVAGEKLTIDAVWLSPKFGIVVFDLVEETSLPFEEEVLQDHQDDIFARVQSMFVQHRELLKNRRLAVPLDVVTYAPAVQTAQHTDAKLAICDQQMLEVLSHLEESTNPELHEQVLAVVQSVLRLRAANKRENVVRDDSRGAKLKELEKTIANLDYQQEKAVIEKFGGLQRIRGLAGSGKTIVLALKAAYLHTQNPEWKIAVTFHTRALKNQFIELIERFCVEKRGELPNWQNLEVLNAWGSNRSPGLYSNFCSRHNVEPLDFMSARRSTTGDPFSNAVNTALSEVKTISEDYDAILIDEAQDLPESFLKLCYAILRPPKRLVYAYDELQQLNEGTTLSSPQAIFGTGADDVILHKCYRNSRPVLVTAHALGFGVYRKKGLVSFFDEPQLWSDVGYETMGGALKPENHVVLARSEESSPKYLEQHSHINDVLVFKKFDTDEEQLEWVAKSISEDIHEEELECRDIVVINSQAVSTKKHAGNLRVLLGQKDIKSHIAGETNADIFFKDDSVSVTGIFRAKGNEVPMVYIINAQECYAHPYSESRNLITLRNTLFTAMTRSKAWVRVCGLGDRMTALTEEFESAKSKGFQLEFDYPSHDEIDRLNVIHRDLTPDDQRTLKHQTEALSRVVDIVQGIKEGRFSIDDYPEDLQPLIEKMLSQDAG
ncbi:MAG: ATP-binding domain-containing protein [Pseudomonadales bacterium]